MDTQENNKLIAEFMGVKPTSTKHTKYWYDGQELKAAGLPFSPGQMGNGTDELNFATSFDWLMPVVGNIENLNYSSTASRIGKEQYKLQFFSAGAEVTGNKLYKTKLEAYYQAVVEFIQWHNKQNS